MSQIWQTTADIAAGLFGGDTAHHEQEAKRDRIEVMVACWHESATDLTLPQWIGWTEDQYTAFVERGVMP